MDKPKPPARSADGGSVALRLLESSSLEDRNLSGRSQAEPPRPTPASEGSTPASAPTGERASFRFGRKNAGKCLCSTSYVYVLFLCTFVRPRAQLGE